MSGVEQHRELVVDGDAAQALELCRRLLRTDSSLQRVKTAHLVLERLRSGDDSSDDVNALLRLLGNYVSPTRELTEEILSLLLFCEHRVLLIHHLPKLTYQSKECVQLVVENYLELLSTDRSLLVPVLGSLAEMPLDNSEKNTVVEATQSLLDAAVEEDIPAVVQSLLSMVTKSSAPKALVRLRTECNRIDSGTLSLTMEERTFPPQVIGRYATAGSVALTALLRLIRHVDPLTSFDVVLLTFVMGKSAENEMAVRTTTSVAQSGRLHSRMMREAAAMLVKPEWAYLLPSFVRCCSCLLAVCFHASTQPALALNLIGSSVDSLIILIETRSTVQEEALMLLLTIASQPKKLLLLANAKTVQRTHNALCWNVAEVIALRFSELARRNPATLASSSHLFLDHLHSIASATLESEIDGRYPSHILDLLCSTMALLTKKERGIYSLLMITIQKQLVSRVGSSNFQGQQSFRIQSGRSLQTRASVVEVKQLMAVFLTGHLLKNQVVVESRDRKSLANWMLRLLTSANRDETLLHVMRFVRDEMSWTRTTSSLEQERAQLTAAISQIFRKKGLSWTPRNQVLQCTKEDSNVGVVFDDEEVAVAVGQEPLTTSLVMDATEFVVKMRFGVPSTTFATMNLSEREANTKVMEQEYLMKICLLRELFHCYVEFAPSEEQAAIVDAGFLLPSAYTLGLHIKTCRAIEPLALNIVIWNLMCALDIAVASTNIAAEQYSSMLTDNISKNECGKQFARMAARLRICLELRDQLTRILLGQRNNIQAHLDKGFDGNSSSHQAETQKQQLEWLLLETSIVNRMLNGQLRRVQGELPRASLFGLDFRVVCLAFEGHWGKIMVPPLTLPHQLELLQIFSRHLQPDAVISSGLDGDDVASSTVGNLRLLVSRSEGQQAVKWLCHLAADLSRTISNDEYDQPGSVTDGDDDLEENATLMVVNTVIRNLMAHSLACIYSSLIVILEECRIADSRGDTKWTRKMMELLASGASPDDDVSLCESPHGHNEMFFRFLARQCLEMTDPTLACLLTDTLVALVLSTRKSPLVSQLCLALLHQTFPSSPTPSQFESDPATFFNGLPLRSLPKCITSPSNGRMCSLEKYRCSTLKWRHIAYLVVGSWSFSASGSAGSFLLAQYLEEMRVLIDAAVPNDERRRKKKRAASFDESDEESDEDDLEEKRRQDEIAIVVDGKHIVLKSLTNESLPYFIEAVLLCAIASLYRAAPKKSSSQGFAGFNPFADYCRAMHVFESTLRVFARAEICGFNVPVKTNALLLRAGAFAARSAKSIITKCIAWRVEQNVSDDAGALEHLSVLFGAVLAMATTMEMVASSFQERVVLKMQSNGNGRRKGGWASELLAKTYGKKYNTRRWISKTEAKLLPFFYRGIQDLQDFLQDQSDVNNIVLETAKAEWEATESVWGNYERRNVMLSEDKLVSACQTLQAEELTPTLLKDWRPAMSIDNDDDETDLEDEDEQNGSQELDEESLSEDEDPDGFVVRSFGTSSASHVNNSTTFSGRKKPAVELQDNEALGFPTIVVNFKKQKKIHKN